MGWSLNEIAATCGKATFLGDIDVTRSVGTKFFSTLEATLDNSRQCNTHNMCFHFDHYIASVRYDIGNDIRGMQNEEPQSKIFIALR